MAFVLKRRTELDIKEEWVLDEETQVELLVTNENRAKFERAFTAAEALASKLDKPLDKFTGNEETPIERQVSSVGMFVVKDWKGAAVEGTPYSVDAFYDLCITSGGISAMFSVVRKYGELNQEMAEQVSKAKGKR